MYPDKQTPCCTHLPTCKGDFHTPTPWRSQDLSCPCGVMIAEAGSRSMSGSGGRVGGKDSREAPLDILNLQERRRHLA
eukprot:752049-Hanusia_phi.AAC.7